jgi:hypothetical protein
MAKQLLKTYVFDSAAGTITVPGKIDLQQLLLITNVTKNTFLYNFADSSFAATSVTFNRANSTALGLAYTTQASDGYSVITLSGYTQGTQTDNDKIQIFVDSATQMVRLSGIGTDAFERARVAAPQSMLDADFEYGLQPTKWQVIDVLRGYPSIYEVPGSDTSVITVVTDASTGTGSVGSSLITVTTVGAHGFSVGTPITVKALANTVTGFARAEGTFFINSVPTTTTFTYYAKAKVGVSNGDILSTTYTQLRRGGLFTGSSIGLPTFIPSGGSVSAFATMRVEFAQPHGLVPGDTLISQISSTGSNHGFAQGPFYVESVPTARAITYTTRAYGALGTALTLTVNAIGAGGAVNVGSASTTNSGTLGTASLSWTALNGSVPVVGMVITGSVNIPAGTTILTVGAPTGAVYPLSLSANIITANVTNASLTASPTFTANQPIVISGTNTGTGSITNYASGTIYHIQSASTTATPVLLTAPSGTPASTTPGTAVGLTSVPHTVVGQIFARPDCFYQHRPFDGGVMLGTGGIAHGAHAIRMSKKYIRYQSGKAINYNTGLLMAPNYDVRYITASATSIGATITITTDDVDHAIQIGATIQLSGVVTSGYNDTYVVNSISDERTFTVLAKSILGNTTPAIGTPCLVSVTNWHGATVRAGTFDDQNGMFWQYDGVNVAVGYRSSTFQLGGVVDAAIDTNNVVTNAASVSKFNSQIFSGERVVMKGMSHIVASVGSDTNLYVTPDFRGSANAVGSKIMRTKDFIIKQSDWNIDRCDGSNGPFNPSGYNLLVNKMQMVGIQWTWYGAGFIEWVLRGPDGNFIPVHRIKHSNVNTEAYMRSGNQPVRYEVINEGARTTTTQTHTSSDTTITVADASFFPSSGYLWVDCTVTAAGNTGPTTGGGEIIKYTGKTATTFTGCTRAAADMTMFTGGSSRIFTGGPAAAIGNNKGVILLNQTATPIISHWGSAFLTDGGFDSDRGYIFNYATTNTTISQKKSTAFALRLAPSVSNGIIGDLGARELLNRAQLLLSGIEITAGAAAGLNSAIVVEGVLNPTNYPTNLANITWTSLQPSSAGGLPSFCQVATGSSITFDNQVSSALVTTPSTTYAAGLSTMVLATPTLVAISSIGANGTINIASATFIANQPILITGAQAGTGALSGYVNTGTIYYVRDAGAQTNITLLSTPGGTPITTTAGTNSGPQYVANPPIVGDEVWSTSAGATFQGNTKVTAVTYATGIPTITIDKPLVGQIINATNVTFSRGTSASPGETVFSFISSPSGKDSLDLTPLKELVNTPIGGRGTFPNGPDVLMINVYITQGVPLTGNLVLRWSEAQA